MSVLRDSPPGAEANPSRQPVADLPPWPFYLLFVGFPFWWLTGFGAFAVTLSSIPMLVLLVQRRRVEVPMIFGLWLAFVVWATFAAVELDGLSRLIGFGFRITNYVGASILFLYVYNARHLLTNRRLTAAMVFFFGFVVVGGYLGVLVPNGSFNTLAQSVLPRNIAQNEYVQSLVHPSFAEVQKPYGSARTFNRPSAPFPYTNSWGCNAALLVTFVIAAVSAARRTLNRLLLLALLLAALVPAFATLNRGMFIAVGMILVYGSIRLAYRGQLVPLVAIVGVGIIGFVVAVQTGVASSLTERLHYSQTNTGRSTIYREAFEGAAASPLFGNGAPRPSNILNISIGTQGQVWNVMFSYGFVALFFFLGWFVCAAVASRAAIGTHRLWAHTAVVVACATFFYYGYDGPQLAVVMVAAAVALRPVEPD